MLNQEIIRSVKLINVLSVYKSRGESIQAIKTQSSYLIR